MLFPSNQENHRKLEVNCLQRSAECANGGEVRRRRCQTNGHVRDVFHELPRFRGMD